jgi:PAS domain-containing protein
MTANPPHQHSTDHAAGTGGLWLRELAGIAETNNKEYFRGHNADLECQVETRTAEDRATNTALRTSEERYRLLADNAREIIWTLDPRGRLTHVHSPIVEQVLGYRSDEVQGLTLSEVFAPGSLAVMEDYLGQLSAKRQAGEPVDGFRGELEQLRK